APRGGDVRPGQKRAPDRVDLRPHRPEPCADAGAVRPPPAAARRRAALARLPDPLPGRPLRAARLLPAGPGRNALRRGGRHRPHGPDLALRPRVGAVPRPALAAARARDPAAPEAPVAAAPDAARARLLDRPPERVDVAAGRLARAPAPQA